MAELWRYIDLVDRLDDRLVELISGRVVAIAIILGNNPSFNLILAMLPWAILLILLQSAFAASATGQYLIAEALHLSYLY